MLGSPRPQDHDSSKTEIEPLQDWYLHDQGAAPTSVHREAVPSLEKAFYGGLDSSILGHYSKNKLAHNLQLPTIQKTSCLVQLISLLKGSCASELLSPWRPRSPPKCNESPSPSLLPPLLWQSHGSSRSHLGRSLCCVPSSLQPLTPTPESARARPGGTWAQQAGTSESPTAAAPPGECSWGRVWGAGEKTPLLLLL